VKIDTVSGQTRRIGGGDGVKVESLRVIAPGVEAALHVAGAAVADGEVPQYVE
jgi:hypothetical protein